MATLTTAFGANPLTDAIIERHMHDTVLNIAELNTVFWKLGRMVKMPKGESKTITFERFPRLVTPRNPLADDGSSGNGKAMTVEKVTCVLEQWGDFITLTDVAMLTVRHEPYQRAMELIGLDAAMTVDREVQRVLIAGTNVYFPNNRADRTLLQAGDTLSTPLIRKLVAKLQRNGAPTYSGGTWVGVVPPEVSADIQADPTFVPAAQYSNLQALQKAEIGLWLNIRWQLSNNIPILTRDQDADPTSVSDVATSGSDVALTADDYTARLIGVDANGFEVMWSATDAGATVGAGEVLEVVVPALPDGITDFNLYVQKGAGSFRLVTRGLAPGTYYVNTSGTHATGDGSFPYDAAGQVSGLTPPANVQVHQAYVFGNEYYACTELSAIEVLKTPPGPVIGGNELDRKRAIGWKWFGKSVITNETFGLRVECASAILA